MPHRLHAVASAAFTAIAGIAATPIPLPPPPSQWAWWVRGLVRLTLTAIAIFGSAYLGVQKAIADTNQRVTADSVRTDAVTASEAGDRANLQANVLRLRALETDHVSRADLKDYVPREELMAHVQGIERDLENLQKSVNGIRR